MRRAWLLSNAEVPTNGTPSGHEALQLLCPIQHDANLGRAGSQLALLGRNPNETAVGHHVECSRARWKATPKPRGTETGFVNVKVGDVVMVRP